MEISESRDGDVLVVAPVGRIDSATSPAFESYVHRQLDAGERRVLVDFSGVAFITSAGLRVMLTLARRLREGQGRLALCGLNVAVHEVFELAGFLPLFDIESGRETARARVTSP